MKTLNLTAIALAATLLMAGTASAASVLGTSSTDVRIDVTDGVASIYGSVDELIEKNLVEHEVSSFDGVEEVNNYLIVTQ